MLGFALPLAAAEPELPNFAQLIDRYGAAVVNISTTPRYHNDKLSPKALTIPRSPQRQDFAREPGDGIQPSQGSGFVLSDDGFILTSAHVVQNATEITVRLIDRREFVASLIGLDSRSDVALLKIEAGNLASAVIGNPANLKVGDWVLAIGSPFGFEYSATTGIVSAKGRSLPDESYIPFIQTDAAINPGNSGGPLFNLKGQVVGMNAQIFSQTGGYMGLSFAVPIDLVLHISEQLKRHGYVKWGWLGCAIQDVTHELATAFGIPEPRGALITDILPGGPAFRSELKVGDIITSYQGKPIGVSSDLPPMVGLTPPGQRVTLEVMRGAKSRRISLTVDEIIGAKPPMARSRKQIRDNGSELGLRLAELSTKERKQTQLLYGVRVTAVSPGPAFDSGMQKGDILLEIGELRIKSVTGFYRHLALAPAGKPLPVRIRRGHATLFVALHPLPRAH